MIHPIDTFVNRVYAVFMTRRRPTTREEEMAERLRELRHGRGLTQTQLAAKAGVPFRTLQNWEYARRVMSFDAAIRLADALEVTLDELAGRAPPARKGRQKAKGGGR
jgi:transcriptional regulator with XRE-family HTH domain